ncbi:MAG: hypothetical protein ACR2JY_23565 [Chloroflexota bacterium]
MTGWHWMIVPALRRRRLVVLLLAVAAPLVIAAPAATAAGVGFNPPQIAIVWPQYPGGHGTSLSQSAAVNVSVWPTGTIACSPPPGMLPAAQLVLGMAHNNEPLTPLAKAPVWTVRDVHGTRFPSEEFNDISADLAADPNGKDTFVVAGGVLSGSNLPSGNVWVHAADPRTYYPRPLQPIGFTTQANPPVDLRIPVVFPHDAQGKQAPVAQAPFVNIAVDIFEHSTTLSVRPSFLQSIPSRYPVSLGLQISQRNDPLQSYRGASSALVVPQQTSDTVNGRQYPRWVFNDVPVDPGQHYHFLAMLSGIQGNAVTASHQFSTIWTHAVDARTFLPTPRTPPPCTP